MVSPQPSDAPVQSGARTRLRHIGALDGVRGAAILGVLFFHAGYLNGGYLGVDLFFVLSGFLITGLLLNEWGRSGGIRLTAFWARRARRLLPALFLMLGAVAAYAAFVALPTQVSQIRGDALATLGYVANWRQIANGSNYFAIFGAPSPLDHTWSLAIEEQFYLVWPLVIVGLAALGRRRVRLERRVFATATAGAVVLGALSVGLAASGAASSRTYYGTDTRAPAILLGAALAAALVLWGPARSRVGRVAVEVAGVAGVAWLAWAWTSLQGQDPFLARGGLLLCGVAAVAVIAAASNPTRGPIAAVASVAPLRWLGLISYGLYLWHWPVFVYLNPSRVGLTGWPLTGVQLAVTLAISIVSYFLVEMPIRRGALRGWRIRVLTPVVVASTVVVLLVGTAGAVAEPQATDSSSGSPTTPSTAPAAPGATRIMIVGDSIPVFLTNSIQDVEPALNVSTLVAGVDGCEVARSEEHRAPAATSGLVGNPITDPPSCTDWPTRWPAELAQFHPTDAVLMLGFPAVQDLKLQGVWHAPCSTFWDRYYESEVVSALRTLGSSGAKVWVTTAAPPSAFYFPTSLTTGTRCLNRALLQAAAATKTSVLDVEGFVCPRGHCQDELDGQILRPDGFHYTGPGGVIVARWLLTQITQPPVPPTTSAGRPTR